MPTPVVKLCVILVCFIHQENSLSCGVWVQGVGDSENVEAVCSGTPKKRQFLGSQKRMLERESLNCGNWSSDIAA